jgi:hypothetical protein
MMFSNDKCMSNNKILQVWRKGNFDIASRWCTVAHKNLHMVFGPGVAGIMRRLGLRRLFVMAHPAIVPTVEMMLSQEGVIGAVYPSAEETVQLAGCFDTSFTFQALVRGEEGLKSHVI